MKVLIAGSSGLVGKALVEALKKRGDIPLCLVRREARQDNELFWNPLTGTLNKSQLTDIDAVVNLAGENIADGRWTAEKKKRMRDSRILTTQNLIRNISTLDKLPQVWINASAVGYYGDTGSIAIDESGPVGKGFLAELCKEWEAAADEAAQLGIRTVKLRIGMVLSPKGGALRKMSPFFKWGLGGKIGSGKQYMSWISIDDLIAMILFALDNQSLSGAINAVSPQPVTNSAFTKAFGKVLNRPTFFPLPAFVARLVFGEMADEVLLMNTQAVPQVMIERGFSFIHPHIEQALIVGTAGT